MKGRLVWIAALSIALVGGSCDGDDDDCCFVVVRGGPSADLNLDGFADLVIGAPLDDGGGTQRGAVFVYFGGPAGPAATPGLTIPGPEDGAGFGASIAFVGDVNAGGAPDLLVGAPLDDGDGDTTDDGTDRGRAFVFFGGPAMDATPDVVITGGEPGGELGFSVARIADTNRDGIDDWIVGAPLDDGDDDATDDGLDRGRAFFFYGGFVPDGIPDVTLTGPEAGSRFGFAVASAGDINAGGADDLAVGAPLDDGDGDTTDDGADRGRVFVFYGGVALDVVPDLVLTGDEDGAELGAAVAPAFDVSGDRIDDLLAGAPLHDAGGGAGADRGEAYVYFGGSVPDATADVVMSGSSDGGAFGASLCRARDANGDGQGDVLVGAPLEDPGALTDAGSAYLFYGGAVLDAVPDLVLEGAEAGAHFGAVVASPGDFDGGGRDLVVGAPLDDADGDATDDGSDRGSAFVFFAGSGVLDGAPEVIVDGTQDGARAASSIAN